MTRFAHNLFFDTEVKAPFVNALDNLGVDAYSRHPRTKLIVLQYAIDNGPETVIDLAHREPIPQDFIDAWNDPSVQIVAHNAGFDRVIMQNVAHCPAHVDRWHCTSVQAKLHGLPGDLETLSAIYELGVDGKMDGKKLIQLFCEQGADPDHHPDEWQRFLLYARLDITAMRRLYHMLPMWNYTETESRLYHLDQRINDRGFKVDLELADDIIYASEIAAERLNGRIQRLTNNIITKGTQRERVKNWLADGGFEIPDMRAETLRKSIRDHHAGAHPLSPEQLEMLEIRLLSSKSSISKCRTAKRMAGPGDRIRHSMTFCGGGRIGRFSHKGFQPGNLPRPSREKDEIAAAIQALQSGSMVTIWGDETLDASADCLRGLIIAEENHRIVAADWSNIEGRKLAWYANEEWKLQAYRDKDNGTGEDLYKLLFHRMMGTPLEEITPFLRQQGKGCLTGETMVLCRSGWKRLDSIAVEDQVWDGEKFVQHEGLLRQGSKDVLQLSGLWLTPDHLVWSESRWLPAMFQAVSNDAISLALASAAGNLSLKVMWLALVAAAKGSSLNAIAALLSTSLSQAISKISSLLGATSAPRKPLQGSVGLSTLKQWLTRSTADAYSAAWRQLTHDAQARTTKSIETMEHEAFEWLNAGKAAKVDLHSCSMFKRCQGGMIQGWRWIESKLMATMSRATFDLLHGNRTSRTDVLSQHLKRNVPVYDLKSVGSKNRFAVLSAGGPLLVHNCDLSMGYEGGVGAFLNVANSYQLDLVELGKNAPHQLQPEYMERGRGSWAWAVGQHETHGLPMEIYVACAALKFAYRDANARIAQLWEDLLNCAMNAVTQKGKAFTTAGGKVTMACDTRGDWLAVHIPSGRKIMFAKPVIKMERQWQTRSDGTKVEKPPRPKLLAKKAPAWRYESLYGGLFANAITQGGCRDILGFGLLNADAAGFPIILHVHDEIVAELHDSDPRDHRDLITVMEQLPPWCPGMPLVAEGFTATRYRK